MKNFAYLRPENISEAIKMKEEYGDNARYWAGGTDLLVLLKKNKLNLDYCIDLSFLSDLEYINKNEDTVTIGALTRVVSVERSEVFSGKLEIVRQAAAELATPGIRTTATIGGNLCHAAPSADMAPPLLALDSEFKLVGSSGDRWVKGEEFFLHVNKTVLKDNEILAEVSVPIPGNNTATCFLKHGRTVVDIAIVNMAMSMTKDDEGKIIDIKIVYGAVAPTPVRMKSAEAMVLGKSLSEMDVDFIERVADSVADEVKPITDVRSTSEYRREISRVLAERALKSVLADFGRYVK